MLKSAEHGAEALQGYMALLKELCGVVSYGPSLVFRDPHCSLCYIHHESEDPFFALHFSSFLWGTESLAPRCPELSNRGKMEWIAWRAA